MPDFKTDYRKGVPPWRRIKECQKAIRNALKQSKKTFGNLLEETGLSRSTLAFHLKEMYKQGHVDREMDLTDYRVTYYSLTEKGKGEIHKQEDVDTLAFASEFLFPPPEVTARLADAIVKFLKPSIREYVLTLKKEDVRFFKECVTYSVYSDEPLKNEVKNHVERLAEQAAKSILFELVESAQKCEIDQAPKISLVFKFEWNKINEFLQKVEKQLHTEPLPKLPDIENYLKKQKAEKRET
jgi:DNA-binding MarR family transcriptional regulator